MNVLFFSLYSFSSFDDHNIYSDLLKEFILSGHKVYAICPSERRNKKDTNVINDNGSFILNVKTLNITKTNLIEKGLSTLLLPYQYKKEINKYFKGVKFDLVLSTTPPITFNSVISYFKKRDHAYTYLMLKDIFPQNAIDIGILRKSGLKGFIYRYFLTKEKKLYEINNKIGCMSEGNKDYLINHYSYLDKDKIEICPNSIKPKYINNKDIDKDEIRNKYDLPLDKKIFVYGGNLGKPQDIDFVINCIDSLKSRDDIYFVILGSGTEYNKLYDYSLTNKVNFKLIKYLPVEEYNKILAISDVGLIFLSNKFTIPNYPSRLLSYLEAGLPVLMASDINSDMKDILNKYSIGYWCQSNDVNNFVKTVDKVLLLNKDDVAIKEKECIKDNFDSSLVYKNCFRNIK